MYLKKLDIRGFKSFGDSISLDIPSGITAVVGPNGCGKSNIADAMRWVLGEQSAKLLRCSTMQDIIFAGTEDRSALGYAQVSMTLDNSDGDLPIDYSEVVVTRRIYRSGESEYLINKAQCRLKDINELFMGTGVGKEGYSIIGQGQIDKILSTRPEDRRNLFEEAAGIYKYKLRKIEAEQKLEKKQENLIRIQDILSELEKRLESLEKQAEKAKNYLDIQGNLKKIELNIFIYQVDKIEEELSKINKAYESLELDYKQNKVKLENNKNTYDKVRSKLSDLQKISQELQNKSMSIKMDIEQKQSSIKVNKEKVKSIDTAVESLNADHQEKSKNHIENQRQIDKLQLKGKKISQEINKEKNNLSKLEEKLQVILNTFKEEVNSLENYQSNIYLTKTKLSTIEANINNKDTFKQQLSLRYRKISENYNDLISDISHLETDYKTLEKNYKEKFEEKTNCLDNIKKLNIKAADISKKQNDIYKLHRKVEDSYHKYLTRYNALQQMKNEYEGFYKSVKNILTLKAKEPEKWEGIYGVVGELIKVPQDLEVAINTALASSVQHIVTKDEETANRVIEYIKRHELGRATFLPVTTVKGYPIGPDSRRIKDEDGFIGFASDLIGYDITYKGIVENLLGRVIVINTLTNAITLAKKYRYRYRIVTLEGEIINPGGSITGGSFYKKQTNIFSRNRELKTLKEDVDRYRNKLNEMLVVKEDYDSKLEQINIRLVEEEKSKSNLEQKVLKLQIEKEKLNNQLIQLKDNMIKLEAEKEELNTQEKTMYTDIDEYKDLVKKLQSRVKSYEEKASQVKESIRQIEGKRDKVYNEITSYKVSLSSKQEILKSIDEQILRLETEIKSRSNENQIYNTKLSEYNNSKVNLLNEIKLYQEDIDRYRKLMDANESEYSKNSNTIEEFRLIEKEKRQEEDKLAKEISLVQDQLYKIGNKINTLELKRENIYSKVWDKYEATYKDALEFKIESADIYKLKKSANKYKDEIKSLGIINTGAIEEFEETKERYKFMKKHEEDIVHAEENLIELIDELTVSMEEIFKEEFKKISDNFNIVFTELFGGGEAFLELTDNDDVLESGIEIIARPPGKKLQNMTLLSGGERALTAIAILFGILRLKPSPFAVLDEIEAALDDANVIRFSNYLKKMGKDMQFLIITHRKGTMAVADTIYGVTMEDKGVSKIVSIQLDDIEDNLKEEEN